MLATKAYSMSPLLLQRSATCALGAASHAAASLQVAVQASTPRRNAVMMQVQGQRQDNRPVRSFARVAHPTHHFISAVAMAAASSVAPSPGRRSFHSSAYLSEVHYKVEKDAVNMALSPDNVAVVDYVKHPVYSQEEVKGVQVTHRPVKTLSDRVALTAISTMRYVFDKLTGYTHDPNKPITEEAWLQRMIFLETVAGVPGMVGGMTRHLHSLRKMRRDYGWIHMLLGEAENERMHLLTFMKLKSPSPMFRAMVLLAQGIFFNMFFMAYLVAPRTCHRFVGYLEEEAVITYSRCIKDLEAGKLPVWGAMPAPDIAKSYWRLPENAMMLDVIYAVRADEQNHRDVNHTLADCKATDPNPLVYGAPSPCNNKEITDGKSSGHSVADSQI